MLLDVVSNLKTAASPFGFINDILGYILNLIYGLLSKVGIENAAVCIIVFTILIKLAMLPTFYKQQKTQKLNTVVQPEIQKIQQKYKNKKDSASMAKQQNELQAVYDKYGTSPTSGCLSTFVTMIVIFALYRVIYNMHDYIVPIKELLSEIAVAIKDSGVENFAGTLSDFAKDNGISAQIYNGGKKTSDIVMLLNNIKPDQWPELAEAFSSSKECVNVINANSTKLNDIYGVVGGLNFRYAPTDKMWPGLLVPVLALVTQVYSIHQMTKKQMASSKDMQDNAMMQSMMTMNKIMPLFSFFICLSMPIGIGIYWILGSVIQIIQTFFFDMHFSKIDVDELVRQNIEKASKKKNSGKKSYMQRMLDAQAELEQQREMSLRDYAHINSKNYSEKNNNDDIDNGSHNNYKTGSISSYANIMKSEKGK